MMWQIAIKVDIHLKLRYKHMEYEGPVGINVEEDPQV